MFHVIRKGELWMIEQRSESGVKWDYKLICARCRASQQHLFPSSYYFSYSLRSFPPLSYIYPHLLYDYQSATLMSSFDVPGVLSPTQKTLIRAWWKKVASNPKANNASDNTTDSSNGSFATMEQETTLLLMLSYQNIESLVFP